MSNTSFTPGITRIMVRYKHTYARPARYTTSTKFIIETPDGERKEFHCGSTYKNYKSFVSAMKKKYGETIPVDTGKPYVMYM